MTHRAFPWLCSDSLCDLGQVPLPLWASLSPHHLVLLVSLRLQAFAFAKYLNPSGEPFQKKYWFWNSRELSESGFPNRGTKSLLTCVCSFFFPFSILSSIDFSVTCQCCLWPLGLLLKAPCWSGYIWNLLRNLCDLLIVCQAGIQVLPWLDPNPPSLSRVLHSSHIFCDIGELIT